MKVHHLNCGSMPGGIVAHCLLIEADESLILVDTGFGTADIVAPDRRIGWTRHVLRPRLRVSETAIHHIGALGFSPTDVRDIVVTHLDYDHVGGLADFPWARVHVHGPELRNASDPSLVNAFRYRPRQWEHGPQWVINELPGRDEWFGFESVNPIEELTDDIRIIPLYGHTAGHVGVAVRADDRWLLHAGDAFVSSLQLNRLLPGLRWAGVGFGEPDVRLAASRLSNMSRLAELSRQHRTDVTVFSSHDPFAFAHLAGGG